MIDWWIVGVAIVVSFVAAIIWELADRFVDKLGEDD